ncbi:hypothetical protein E2C01_025888 [Portunus trituberculatus]|uniref:Uncharacterized protein n=1 Tax=Portunus trituberculatus TaxID=210409 RepID=A0A5B7EHQ3_PORTR|nr:hypothetical protein [Portunus trituberculatus]
MKRDLFEAPPARRGPAAPPSKREPSLLNVSYGNLVSTTFLKPVLVLTAAHSHLLSCRWALHIMPSPQQNHACSSTSTTRKSHPGSVLVIPEH